MAVNLKSAELKVYVYKGDQSKKGSPKYTLSKNKIAGDDNIVFEIAELVKDHMEIEYNSTPDEAEVTYWVQTELTRTFEDDQTNATAKDINPLIRQYVAFRGFGELFDTNSITNTNINPDLNQTALISNRTIYKPEDEPVFIPFFKTATEGTYKIQYFNKSTSLGSFTTGKNVSTVTADIDGVRASRGTDRLYDASITHLRQNDSGGFISGQEFASNVTRAVFTNTDGTETVINIENICEPKYTPIKVSFLNKFGAIQELWFMKRKDRSFDVKKESYRHSTLDYGQNFNFNTSSHPTRDFDINGTKKITMNTGFVTEDHNEVIKQLLVSEFCWIHDSSNGIPTPIKASNMSFTEKTGVNDKLINFTLDFEYSHNYIQSVR